jgi:hypothetical protein
MGVPECSRHTIEIDIGSQVAGESFDIRRQELALLVYWQALSAMINRTLFIPRVPEQLVRNLITPIWEIFLYIYL